MKINHKTSEEFRRDVLSNRWPIPIHSEDFEDQKIQDFMLQIIDAYEAAEKDVKRYAVMENDCSGCGGDFPDHRPWCELKN